MKLIVLAEMAHGIAAVSPLLIRRTHKNTITATETAAITEITMIIVPF